MLRLAFTSILRGLSNTASSPSSLISATGALSSSTSGASLFSVNGTFMLSFFTPEPSSGMYSTNAVTVAPRFILPSETSLLRRKATPPVSMISAMSGITSGTTYSAVSSRLKESEYTFL